ncbi:MULTISPECIES: MaoC/PaaZ C-terminal domain-containing protein [Actinomyces]|uniref:MaoC-like domain-containing protein n=1 Tax=Actinomyces respiraculi TaxID=2744574 RepID=A0A7T0LLA8_9ACTO|nr:MULTISPECIES: MaoC/PaaZ C-terminal domain-containing protein [Actinomyces]QPL05790.1 hypothetical protein ID810_02075 [Actinomyces respiraculi]
MSGPASHPTGGASSCAGADVDPSAIADCLSSVLARLTWESDGVAEVTARATRLLLPALTTLAALRPHLGTWDGIVHRRCRLVPLSGSGEGARSGGGQRRRGGGETDGVDSRPAWLPAARGWRTLTVSLVDGGIEATHWLARHDGGAEARTATASPSAPPLSGADAGEQELLLTPAELAAWARATGDRNALHLVPGAAARAGLEAGEADVVAHGTLLAALSLAVAPAQRVDLPFLAPAVVPPGGLRLRLEPHGDVLSGGGVLLRRR